jgi:hypothetical protein
MTRVQRTLLGISTGATLLVLATVAASATTAGQAALRAGGQRMVLTASAVNGPQPNGGSGGGGQTSGTGLGPVQVAIGNRWTLQGQLIVKGNITVTCGPFAPGTSSAGGSITVEEVAGGHVAHATIPNGQLPQLTCDGASHTVPITVLATDLPFEAADGAAALTVNACGQSLNSFQFVCQPSGTAIGQITVVR